MILGRFSHDPRSGLACVLGLAFVRVELVFDGGLSFCKLTATVHQELGITTFADSEQGPH